MSVIYVSWKLKRGLLRIGNVLRIFETTEQVNLIYPSGLDRRL